MNRQIVSLKRAVPRYLQVKNHILDMIGSGKLGPNDRVPSEHELSRDLGVSRMTANRALRELAEEGYLTRLAGVGTFVADSRPHSDAVRVRNIADEVHSRGHEHSAKVIRLEAVKADQYLVDRLNVRLGAKLFHSLILHLESGQPIQLEDRYVCPRLAPDYLKQDFTSITPNVYLTKVAPLHAAEHIIRAEIPTAKVRRHLRMDKCKACLVIRRRTWSGGRPVSLAELSHPGDSYELIGTIPDGQDGPRS